MIWQGNAMKAFRNFWNAIFRTISFSAGCLRNQRLVGGSDNASHPWSVDASDAITMYAQLPTRRSTGIRIACSPPMTEGFFRNTTTRSLLWHNAMARSRYAAADRRLVAMIERNGEYIVPNGGTEFRAGDVVLVLGDKEVLQKVRTLLTVP